jgi:hypothetical protein
MNTANNVLVSWTCCLPLFFRLSAETKSEVKLWVSLARFFIFFASTIERLIMAFFERESFVCDKSIQNSVNRKKTLLEILKFPQIIQN